MKKIKSLFCAANPLDTVHLSLDKEIREITDKLRSSEYRDAIELMSAWAMRPDDLLQSLNIHKPQIVHFSAHGSPTGEIILVDNNGFAKPVTTQALKFLFSTLKDNIQLVIFNACYSKVQAKAIIEIIDFAIGMNAAIGDDAAVDYIASFYRALGFGRSIKEAHEQGITKLLLEGIPEEHIPELWVKHGLDPSLCRLIDINEATSLNRGELEHLYKLGKQHLESHSYQQATKAFEVVLEKGSKTSDVYYYLVLSILGGTRPKLVKLPTIKNAEQYLQIAVTIDSNCPHIYGLWALIKYDYYVLNHVFERSPSWNELFNLSKSVNKEHIREITSHIQAPGNKVWDFFALL